MLRIWQQVNWFCNWKFWRDSYANRTVEAIGIDWVVLRSKEYWETFVEFYYGSPEDLEWYEAIPDYS